MSWICRRTRHMMAPLPFSHLPTALRLILNLPSLSPRSMPYRCAPPGWWHAPMPLLEITLPAEVWITSAPSTTWRPARATCALAASWPDTQVSVATHYFFFSSTPGVYDHLLINSKNKRISVYLFVNCTVGTIAFSSRFCKSSFYYVSLIGYIEYKIRQNPSSFNYGM